MKNRQLTVLTLFGALALTAAVPVAKDSASLSLFSKGRSDGSVTAPETNAEGDLPWADGVQNYTGGNYAVKEEILGQLESYVLDNFIGGIPFADNAGNIMYADRLTLPSETYVPGYGFGVGEGTITAPLTSVQEPETKYSMYYHTWQSQDPGTINYWDGQDSVTADLHAMVSSAYWSTRFNEDKTGYEWYPQLAIGSRPEALNPVAPDNPEDFTLATKWSVKVRVDDALVYDTLSTKANVSTFKGRKVQLEDYLTPFKAMLDGQLFRATDLGSATSGFTGVKEYLAAVQKGEKPSWDVVTGIQLNEEEGTLEFEFNSPKTAFYAMYGLSSTLYSPVPQEFIDAIGGVKEYGKPNIDSILSLGMYTLEEWQSDKQVAFKKNTTYFESDRATHAGYKYTILKDANIAFEEFIANKLDSASIPSAKKAEFLEDPRTRKTLGDTVWKLQVNAADPERWEELFGTNGKVYPHSEDTYWDLKPVMSNKNFLNGLYYAIDREVLAANNGRNPAQAFLSDAYMIDPEAGVSFRDSVTGKAILENRSPETFGHSTEGAAAYFNAAMAELVTAGKYVKGTVAAPTKINLSLIYQTVVQVTDEGGIVKDQLETAFNDSVEGFELVVEPYATANWMDAYYKPMQGDFDLAFGSISGNTLDPLSFMDTVLDDNRSGFTLSWGVDTNLPTQDIRFDGKAWSFQALFEAGTSGSLVKNGAAVTLFKFKDVTANLVEGTSAFTITATGVYYVGDEDLAKVEIVGFEVFFNEEVWEPGEADVVIDMKADGTFVVTITVPESAGILGADYTDLTIHYVTTVGGVETELYQYIEFLAPALPVVAETGLSALEVTGIVVGSVAAVGLLGTGLFFFLKKKKVF